jgi:hypothetical protein
MTQKQMEKVMPPISIAAPRTQKNIELLAANKAAARAVLVSLLSATDIKITKVTKIVKV